MVVLLNYATQYEDAPEATAAVPGLVKSGGGYLLESRRLDKTLRESRSFCGMQPCAGACAGSCECAFCGSLFLMGLFSRVQWFAPALSPFVRAEYALFAPLHSIRSMLCRFRLYHSSLGAVSSSHIGRRNISNAR